MGDGVGVTEGQANPYNAYFPVTDDAAVPPMNNDPDPSIAALYVLDGPDNELSIPYDQSALVGFTTVMSTATTVPDTPLLTT